MRKVEDETLNSLSRAIRKPMMEKRRRARMNESLDTLKNILLKQSSTSLQFSCQLVPSRLDKADILEMTVLLLQELLKRQNSTTESEEVLKNNDVNAPWRPW